MYLYILFIIFIMAIVIIFTYLTDLVSIKTELFVENTDSEKTFMVRDVKTNFWLNTDKNGIAKFGPSGFGFNFRMSKTPEEFLPLRSANNPNDYLISTTNGKDDFRIVTNPGSNLLKIQIMNLEGKNILGYTNENNKDVFIFVEQSGFIKTVTNPADASFITMIFT